MPIDLSKIKPYQGSQDNAFEELVCQIVRRTIAAGNQSWRRLNGAGGDGGVEAYWEISSGEIGLQAKYFTQTNGINKQQIISSFETALTIHPKLNEYRVYLACNLTGPTGRKGVTGVDIWKDIQNAMEKKAQGVGRTVSIVLQTETDIVSELARPECVGLSLFWFGGIEITPEKLKRWLSSAQTALGERYHPEDHVEMDAQNIVRVLSRSQKIRLEFSGLIEKVREIYEIRPPKKWESEAARVEEIRALNKFKETIENFDRSLYDDPSFIWPIADWKKIVEDAFRLARTLHSATYADRSDDSADGVSYFRNKVSELISAFDQLQDFINSDQITSEVTRAALIEGVAGSGKSHLLAASVQEMLDEGGVGVLFLGQRFVQGSLWGQIADLLDSHGFSQQELLGAFDAAAIAARRRGVIAIDALNEGSLRDSWRTELEPFIEAVLAFPNLAVIVSCRDVYVSYIFSDRVRTKYPQVTVQGFTSSEEQEKAAQVYLDRRGIARPPVPWLAPEFTNPLFLRSCCLALESSGRKEFPTGLIGTKQLLSFYIEAIAAHLNTLWDGTTQLTPPCSKSFLQIAKEMANKKQDWLERAEADQIVSSVFSGFSPPTGMSWLDVLIRNGVLREDPHPKSFEETDPLLRHTDVIRFAFQRFQDHLMSEALLEGVTDIKKDFEKDGQLSFLLHSSGDPRWTWNGVFEALSIQLPEKFQIELIDALPGGYERFWQHSQIERAFIESTKWRNPKFISERSLYIMNRISGGVESIIELLVGLAPRLGHPWNAEFINSVLLKRKRPERDVIWTVPVSIAGGDSDSSVYRLIVWSETALKKQTDPKVIKLCALALCWFLTSTSRRVRDGATKALAALFVDSPLLFVEMSENFLQIDDVYVPERLLAAGYGSLLRHYSDDKAKSYAAIVWRLIFNRKSIRPNFLLRDYAAGIMELAKIHGVLPSEVEYSKTQPPYHSKAPNFRISESQIKRLAKIAGGDQILRSCREWGDFYRYEIETRMRDILNVPLTSPPPYTARQLANKFEEEMDADSEKSKALQLLRKAIWAGTSIKLIIFDVGVSAVEEETKNETELQNAITEAEKNLLKLLTPAEYEKYKADWLPHYSGNSKRGQLKPISTPLSARWIARRAYKLGWTKKRFDKDLRSFSDYSRDRPRVERIGKKYQWIARSELLSRLVDNFWLNAGYDDSGPEIYGRATDLSFERDVEPTLFNHPNHIDGEKYGELLNLTHEPIIVPALEGEARFEWPFQTEPAPYFMSKCHVNDKEGNAWIRLSWHATARQRTSLHRKNFGHNFALQQFFFTFAAFCKKGEGQLISEAILKEGRLDGMYWEAPSNTDGPYLYEVANRTWPVQQWRTISLNDISFQIAKPVEDYLWEHHLDATLTDGFRAEILAGWLMRNESLQLDKLSHQLIRDKNGQVVAWSSENPSWSTDVTNRGHGIVVRKEWLENYLARNDLDLILLTLGENEAWRNGDDMGARFRRRFEGIQVLSDGKWINHSWNKDDRYDEKSEENKVA